MLKNIKASTPEVQVILMTGYADIQTAVLAMKLGAFDYVAKPVIPDEILKKIQDTLEQTAVPEQKKRTKKPQSVPYIKGTSLEADKLYEYIRLVAPTMMTVLITGESGSGKEYIARLIHAQSNRKEAPFIAVDCGAIPKDLAASEFFGHVKGAFTGAVNDKTGYFVAASGGTIFLDEIGNLSYDAVSYTHLDVYKRQGTDRSETVYPYCLDRCAATGDLLVSFAYGKGRSQQRYSDAGVYPSANRYAFFIRHVV